jgi:hypothetical protein
MKYKENNINFTLYIVSFVLNGLIKSEYVYCLKRITYLLLFY